MDSLVENQITNQVKFILHHKQRLMEIDSLITKLQNEKNQTQEALKKHSEVLGSFFSKNPSVPHFLYLDGTYYLITIQKKSLSLREADWGYEYYGDVQILNELF